MCRIDGFFVERLHESLLFYFFSVQKTFPCHGIQRCSIPFPRLPCAALNIGLETSGRRRMGQVVQGSTIHHVMPTPSFHPVIASRKKKSIQLHLYCGHWYLLHRYFYQEARSDSLSRQKDDEKNAHRPSPQLRCWEHPVPGQCH